MKARHISIWLVVGYYYGKLRAVLLRMLGHRGDLQDPSLRGEGYGVLIHYFPRYSDDLRIPSCGQSRTFVTRVNLCQRPLHQRLGTCSW